MRLAAAINFSANATRAAGGNALAACNKRSTIPHTFLSQSYTAMADLRNLERQTPKPDGRFKL